MPDQTSGLDVGAVQTAPTTSKRFELPALEFKFGSLTDGTGIPPPLPSPKEEDAPALPKTPIAKEETKKHEANGTTNGHGTSPKSDIIPTINTGLKRSVEDGPASPTLSSRGSLRRLLSKTLLNNAYDEQESVSGQAVASRPPSRTASTIAEERKSKRSSGWFRRLRSNDNANITTTKRVSHDFGEVKKPLGPPPPMIPELSALETKVDTNLGDDLFKGIGKDT
ncbi:hypothetical protein F5Y15DRAFT_237573 [Xylariaceae sp. FL0016]|nr:hypothetical protein F5Y15DRAFT_237573 [Xylariaceae sp. FL0016]